MDLNRICGDFLKVDCRIISYSSTGSTGSANTGAEFAGPLPRSISPLLVGYCFLRFIKSRRYFEHTYRCAGFSSV